MTRDQLRKKAQRLREQGLKYREIAERLRLTSPKAAWVLCNPERVAVSERRRSRAKVEWRRFNYRGKCRVCGEVTSSRTIDLCRRCEYELRRARFPEIQRRWLAGESLHEIAEALGSNANSLGVTVARMREQGWNVPYRYELLNPKHPGLRQAA